MKNLNITKGLWQPKQFKTSVIVNDDDIVNQDLILGFYGNDYHDNSILICDAGNTYQRCGKLPSELEAENERLRGALKNAITFIEDGADGKSYEGFIDTLNQALKGTGK